MLKSCEDLGIGAHHMAVLHADSQVLMWISVQYWFSCLHANPFFRRL